MSDKLYIVIPAYNEEDNIEQVVNDWYPIIERVGNGSRLVVVDDGSKDSTYKLLQQIALTKERLIVLTKANGGHGSTILYGYKYALVNNADYIFQTDSDGQTSADEFEAFWVEREKYSMVIGHRNHREDGMARIFVTKTLRIILLGIFGVNVLDANTPFRLMKRDPLDKVLKIIPEGYNLPNVIIPVAFKIWGEKIKYLPITFRARQGGTNSINIPKIIKIGVQAIVDFVNIKKKICEMNNFNQ